MLAHRARTLVGYCEDVIYVYFHEGVTSVERRCCLEAGYPWVCNERNVRTPSGSEARVRKRLVCESGLVFHILLHT